MSSLFGGKKADTSALEEQNRLSRAKADADRKKLDDQEEGRRLSRGRGGKKRTLLFAGSTGVDASDIGAQ